jgi:hypothetical protein
MRGPSWVRSGRAAALKRCPPNPRKRTFVSAFWISALGQKQTSALSVGFEKTAGVPLLRCRSNTRYGQDRHYLHGFAREYCEVRMVFEKLRGGLV